MFPCVATACWMHIFFETFNIFILQLKIKNCGKTLILQILIFRYVTLLELFNIFANLLVQPCVCSNCSGTSPIVLEALYTAAYWFVWNFRQITLPYFDVQFFKKNCYDVVKISSTPTVEVGTRLHSLWISLRFLSTCKCPNMQLLCCNLQRTYKTVHDRTITIDAIILCFIARWYKLIILQKT